MYKKGVFRPVGALVMGIYVLGVKRLRKWVWCVLCRCGGPGGGKYLWVGVLVVLNPNFPAP